MMDYGGYWGPGNGAVGWLLMCLTFAILLGVVAAVVVVLVRHREQRSNPTPAPTAAEPSSRILDERFARGEIDDEEYRRRRLLLRSPT
jgi:putative membrane protein